MTTPWKLLIHKNDPWTVKAKKRLARWLWEDLTALQDTSEARQKLPYEKPPPRRLLDTFDVRKHFSKELERAQEEDDGA